MQLLVGTTPVQLPVGGSGRVLMQNLGPGDLYFDADNDEDVNSDTGVKLPVGGMYEFPTAAADDRVWVVASEADTDVRVTRVAGG